MTLTRRRAQATEDLDARPARICLGLRTWSRGALLAAAMIYVFFLRRVG
jgi:hypothetical protein